MNLVPTVSLRSFKSSLAWLARETCYPDATWLAMLGLTSPKLSLGATRRGRMATQPPGMRSHCGVPKCPGSKQGCAGSPSLVPGPSTRHPSALPLTSAQGYSCHTPWGLCCASERHSSALGQQDQNRDCPLPWELVRLCPLHPVLGPHDKEDTEALEHVQRRAT